MKDKKNNSKSQRIIFLTPGVISLATELHHTLIFDILVLQLLHASPPTKKESVAKKNWL